DELQAQDKKIFEYWGHAASYLPMNDYRFYLHHMHAFHDPKGKWEKERLKKCSHIMEAVLERIRGEGALGSKDFETPPGTKKGAWWDWQPAKIALEMLFWRGDLMITERKNFHRRYDLTGRVLPGWVDTRVPSEEELARFYVLKALTAHGIVSAKDIFDHIHAARKKSIESALTRMIKSGEITGVQIDALDKKEYYVFPGFPDDFPPVSKQEAPLHFLSPFDNLIILRDRVRDLFGFDYTLECYTPPAKRKYGYFSLPVLWGDKFIARMDAKAERKTKTLLVRNIIFEKGFKNFKGVLPAFNSKLKAFAQFNCCKDILVEKTEPAEFKNKLGNLGIVMK
ncbi:MAG TPA: crosslink repair DNA glycosylase YcaQ family protein, partial [Candidatus Kapabacteria bacterium]|nr:crosslink repair DNA glycosylase YcaQ family protein [Candidatus Kapabacteria bacterium]